MKVASISRLVRLKNLLKEYAKTTQFHGFAILSDASGPLMVTWGILIALAFGMAARDFGKLVDFYQSEPTTLSVSVESNSNFIIPNPTLCMETAVPYLNYSTTDISIDIDAMIASADNLTSNGDYKTMSYLLFYYTYSLLSYWTDAEMRLVGQQQDYHRRLFTDWSIQDPKLSESIQLVYEIYKSRNVSLANLKRLVARQICLWLIHKASKYNNFTEILSGNAAKVTKETCGQDMVTHMSFSLICIKVFSGTSVQLNDSNPMSVRYGPIVPFDNYGLWEYYYWLSQLPRSNFNPVSPPPSSTSMNNPDNTWVNYRWYLDLQGRSTLPQLSGDSVFSWNPLENTFVSISVASEFQFYNAKSRPCATETQYDCEWRQRVAQIRQKCGCWPSSLIFVVNSTLQPRCEVDLSAAYGATAVVGRCKGDANLTIQPCLSECQLISYDIGQRESSYWDISFFRYLVYKSLPYGRFEVTLQTSSQRLVITESLYKDWTTFAAEFGGSIGTWLGGSLLTFVHLPFFFLTKLLKRP